MDKGQFFREVLNENQKRIYRICCCYFNDEAERKDAYQESLVRIWENIHLFRGQSKASTWVYRVVVNTCLSGLRSDKRRKKLIDGGKGVDNINLPDISSDDTDQVAEEKLVFFHRFLQNLNHVDRTLVSLYLEELSTKEMAEITGVSEANVRVKIFRIKEQIKKQWEEHRNGIG